MPDKIKCGTCFLLRIIISKSTKDKVIALIIIKIILNNVAVKFIIHNSMKKLLKLKKKKLNC